MISLRSEHADCLVLTSGPLCGPNVYATLEASGKMSNKETGE